MDLRNYFQVGVWHSSLLSQSSPLIYQCESSIKTSNFSESWGVFLTTTGEAYEILQNTPELFLLTRKIKQISCNISIVCLVSTTGQLFIKGKDPSEFGLLGIPNCYESDLVPILPSILVFGASVGPSHVGVLDRSGNMYTWGTGNDGELGTEKITKKQPPTLIQSAKIFSVKQINCGAGFTAICTAGGFLYIYGKLPHCSQFSNNILKSPYSIKGSEKLFVSQIVSCADFITILSDNKEAFITHGCLQLIKLPYKYKTIAGSSSVLYGITNDDQVLHEWKFSNEYSCRISNLEANVYAFDESCKGKVQIFSGSLLSLSFPCINKTQGIMKLVSNLKIQIENANETQNVIKKCRYSNDHKILRGGKMASRIVLMQLKDCFAELKEYVNMKRFWNMNKKMSQLIDFLSKSYQRINVIHKSKAFKEFLYCNKLVEELGIIRKIKNAEVVLEALKKKLKSCIFLCFSS